MNTYLMSGDCGDAISALPIIRHLGGGIVVLALHVGPGFPREPMTRDRADFLLPVIAAQPYVEKAYFSESPTGITHDLSTFRLIKNAGPSELLTHWHARHLGLQPKAIDLSPWIHVTPSPETKGKVVIARSLRYHNMYFHWRKLLSKHRGRTVFIGLPFEYEAFAKTFGPIDYRPVMDALEMAQLIAGSDLFVGNQSFPCWLALAMGSNLIQESYPPVPNSRIPRPNARFVLNQFSM